ncbi:MAG: methyltransferase domain-containing protein [archaeon]|nr:methyltransferase domain-containing protein [archaeon]
MLTFKPYTHETFFGNIPDIETKTLLDIGAGPYCEFLWGYINSLNNSKNLWNKKIEEIEKNTVAIDIKYPKYTLLFPERCICADANTLPFADRSFDIVSMGWLLDYFSEENKETDNPKINSILEETNRVLKPEGYLIGDVLLYPNRYLNGLSTIPYILDCTFTYMQQIKGFSNTYEKNGFKMKEKAVGYNKRHIPHWITFYFIMQKT